MGIPKVDGTGTLLYVPSASAMVGNAADQIQQI